MRTMVGEGWQRRSDGNEEKLGRMQVCSQLKCGTASGELNRRVQLSRNFKRGSGSTWN